MALHCQRCSQCYRETCSSVTSRSIIGWGAPSTHRNSPSLPREVPFLPCCRKLHDNTGCSDVVGSSREGEYDADSTTHCQATCAPPLRMAPSLLLPITSLPRWRQSSYNVVSSLATLYTISVTRLDSLSCKDSNGSNVSNAFVELSFGTPKKIRVSWNLGYEYSEAARK